MGNYTLAGKSSRAFIAFTSDLWVFDQLKKTAVPRLEYHIQQ
jgi:hypothetical protein